MRPNDSAGAGAVGNLQWWRQHLADTAVLLRPQQSMNQVMIFDQSFDFHAQAAVGGNFWSNSNVRLHQPQSVETGKML